MYSSTDYHCSWPTYKDPSHSMAEQYFPAPTWHRPSSRRHANNEEALRSMDRPYFQNFHCARSPRIRRNLFPLFYNCCSPDKKCRSPGTPFQDPSWETGSRNSNFVFHQDSTTKDYDEVSRFSEQNTPVRRCLEYCSPIVWPAEEVMNSYNDDVNKFFYATNQCAIEEENNFLHSSYSNSQEFPINFFDSELFKTQINSDSRLSVTVDHRNNLPKATLVRETKSQANVCPKNNSEIASSSNNSQDPLLDILESIMRDAIWTPETEKKEPTKQEQHEYFQENETSVENGSICVNMAFAKCNHSEKLKRQTQNTQQDMDEVRNSSENSDQNSSVVIHEMQKPNRQTSDLYANKSDLSRSELLDSKECGEIKISTSSDDITTDDKNFSITNYQIKYQKDDNSNSEETQLTYELIEKLNKSENQFPEHFVDGSGDENEKNTEYSRVEVKKLQDISGLENNITQDNVSTSCSEFKTLDNMTNELGILDNFSLNEIVENVPFHSSDMRDNTIINNDFYTNTDYFTNQMEWNLSSVTNYCLEEPAQMPILSLLDNEVLDCFLSSHVAPDSILKEKEKVDSSEEGCYFEKEKEDEHFRDELLSKYLLNEELHKFETLYEAAFPLNPSLQCDAFHLKMSTVGAEEKPSIETNNTPLRANLALEPKTPVKSILESAKIDGALDPNSILENIPCNSNSTEFHGVTQASDIYFECPQSSKFLEVTAVGNESNTNHLDLIQNKSINQRNQIIEQNPNVRDHKKLKPISEWLVSDVLNSRNLLPSLESEEKQETNDTSFLKSTKPRHCKARLPKMEAINIEVDEEGSMDDPVKEVDFSDSACRKQSDKLSAMLLAEPALKSNLRKRKKPNVFEAIEGLITSISAQPSSDSSRPISDSSINVASRRRKSKRSNELIIISDISENPGIEKNNENKNGTQLTIAKTSPQTSRVLRKRKRPNSYNPSSKQLKS